MKPKSKKLSALILFEEWRSYLRVSDEDKQSPERSFAMQREQIQKSLYSNSTMPVGREYIDLLTGTTVDRDDFQLMIADAEAGRFSHLAIYRADRFCRNAVEGMQVTQKLVALGIKIRMAAMPSLAPETPDGQMMFYLLMTMAQYEVDVLRLRTDGGMKAKLLAGGWAHKAPEGYKNCERAVSSNKYDRWIEIDSSNIKAIRRAWQLLLTDEYTLVQICQILTKEGYIRSSGRPWAWVDAKTKQLRTADVSLYKIYHNPLYAGWVTSEKFEIKIGQIRGTWEPAISTEEFERGLEILRHHDMEKSRTRRYVYLLRDILYMEHENQLHMMYGSTPTGRSHPYPYYLTHTRFDNIRIHLPCETIDSQFPLLLQKIKIEPQSLPRVKAIFSSHLNLVLSSDREENLSNANDLKRLLRHEEEKLARLFIAGDISENSYKRLRSDQLNRLAEAERIIRDAKRDEKKIKDDVEAALELFPLLDDLYELMDKQTRRFFLRVFIDRIIVNPVGAIIRWELSAPFQYLSIIAQKIVPVVSSQFSQGAQKDSRNPCGCFALTAQAIPHQPVEISIEEFPAMLRFEQRNKLAELCYQETLGKGVRS